MGGRRNKTRQREKFQGSELHSLSHTHGEPRTELACQAVLQWTRKAGLHLPTSAGSPALQRKLQPAAFQQLEQPLPEKRSEQYASVSTTNVTIYWISYKSKPFRGLTEADFIVFVFVLHTWAFLTAFHKCTSPTQLLVSILPRFLCLIH